MTDENSFGNSMSKNWPRWRDKAFVAATALFFFLLPLQTRYIFREMPFYEYGTLSVFLVEIWGWVVIALGFMVALKHGNTRTLAKGCYRVIVLSCLSVITFLSILWSPDKAVALQAAVRLLEGVLLFAVLAAPRDQATTKSGLVTSAAFAFLAGAVVQAGLGIYQFLSQSSFASTLFGMAMHDPRALGTSVVEFGDQRWLRAYGGLPNPNVLGGYLVVALAVLIHGSTKALKHKNIERLVGWGMLLVFLTGIFFSFSRAAWIAAIVVMGYWGIGLLKNRTRRNLVYVLLTTFYVLLLVLTFRPLVATRIFHTETARLEIKSRTERVSEIKESWELIKKHPFLGVGIGNYTQALARDVRPGDPLYSYQSVHNVLLLVFAELGIFGIALFLFLLYVLWRQSKNYLLLTTVYVLFLFDHYFWTLPFGILLFWAILGLSTHKTQTQT